MNSQVDLRIKTLKKLMNIHYCIIKYVALSGKGQITGCMKVQIYLLGEQGLHWESKSQSLKCRNHTC